MDLSKIVVYVIVAAVVLFLLPKLGIRPGRGGGNSPLNPPGNNPGSGGGGGLFPTSPTTPDKPGAKKATSGGNDGDFADRIEGDRPSKST
jgi:hypothetical protein